MLFLLNKQIREILQMFLYHVALSAMPTNRYVCLSSVFDEMPTLRSNSSLNTEISAQYLT